MRSRAEWLETDGLGGFASGTISGARTRRYHAILMHAATPPTGRTVLVNGFDAWVDTPDGRYALVLNRQSGDMAVVRIASLSGRRQMSAPLFMMVPVGSEPVSAAVWEV